MEHHHQQKDFVYHMMVMCSLVLMTHMTLVQLEDVEVTSTLLTFNSLMKVLQMMWTEPGDNIQFKRVKMISSY